MEVVALGSGAALVLARHGVPQGSVEVVRAFDHGLQAQILVAQLLHRAVRIRFFFKAEWHSQKSAIEVYHLQRVDAPQVQTNASLLLDGFSVLEEMPVARRQDADHAQVQRLEPCAQVHGNVVRFLAMSSATMMFSTPSSALMRLMLRRPKSVTIPQS